MTREHWDDVVASWRGTRRQSFLRAYSDAVNEALLRRWLPDLTGQRVLKTDLFDEAVGRGLHPLLRSLGATVAAVDLSPIAVAAAGERYPDVEGITGDVRDLPYPDASFDVVVSNSTLDHFTSVADIGAALRELRRVLRSGGVLVVTLDNPRHPLVALRNALPLALWRRLRLVPYQVGTTCDQATLIRVLREAGFEVTDTDAIMHFPRVIAGLLGSLSARLSFRPILALEALSRLSTRRLTGQFIAVRAVND
jgi:SAM-dependent methyltransferase